MFRLFVSCLISAATSLTSCGRSTSVFLGFARPLRVSDHVAKWRSQVVGDGVGKGFQFFVGRFELRSPFGELYVEFANFVLPVPALFHLDLKVVAGMTKAVLNSASNSAERGDNCRPCDENEKVRYIVTGKVE